MQKKTRAFSGLLWVTWFFQLCDSFKSELTLETFLLIYRWPAFGLLCSIHTSYLYIICFTENILFLISVLISRRCTDLLLTGHQSVWSLKLNGVAFIKEVHRLILNKSLLAKLAWCHQTATSSFTSSFTEICLADDSVLLKMLKQQFLLCSEERNLTKKLNTS